MSGGTRGPEPVPDPEGVAGPVCGIDGRVNVLEGQSMVGVRGSTFNVQRRKSGRLFQLSVQTWAL